jgi:hypothetical protein
MDDLYSTQPTSGQISILIVITNRLTVTRMISTNHNISSLAEDFNFSFKIAETPDSNDDCVYNFKPYEGYVYTEGDEAKIKCLNDGYETVWNSTINQFEVLPVQAQE